MNELQQVLNDIKQDKNTNLLPGNLRDNVTCLGIEGTAEVPTPVYATTDYYTFRTQIQSGYSYIPINDWVLARNSNNLYAYYKGNNIGNITLSYSGSSYYFVCTLNDDYLIVAFNKSSGYQSNYETFKLTKTDINKIGDLVVPNAVTNGYCLGNLVYFDNAKSIMKYDEETNTISSLFTMSDNPVTTGCIVPNIVSNYSTNSSGYSRSIFKIQYDSINNSYSYINKNILRINGVNYFGNKIFIDGNIYELGEDLTVGSLIKENAYNVSTSNFKCLNDKYYLYEDELYIFNEETNTFEQQPNLVSGNYYCNTFGCRTLYIDYGTTYYDSIVFNTSNKIIGYTFSDNIVLSNDRLYSSNYILNGKVFYDNFLNNIIGTMPNNGELNITPTTENQNIPEGYTSGGTVLGDENLKSENIKKDVSIFGVTGSLESSSGQIKLFETEEEMQADSTAKEADYAVVYDDSPMKMEAGVNYNGSLTMYFPKVVTLDEAVSSAISNKYWTMLDYNDVGYSLTSSSFKFGTYDYMEDDITGEYVTYTSSDGITYTRTTDKDSITFELEYEVVLSTSHSIIGNFLLLENGVFRGLYKYDTKLNELKSKGYINPVVTDKVLSYDKLSSVDINTILPCLKTIYNNDNKSYGRYIVVIKNNGDIFAYDYKDGNSSTDYWTFPGIICDGNKIYISQNYTSSTTHIFRKHKLNTEDGTVESETLSNLSTYQYQTVSDELNKDDIITILTNDGVTSTITVDFFGENSGTDNLNTNRADLKMAYAEESKYYSAKTQFTIEKPNELLPGLIAYGKSGDVTGDGTIYNNLDCREILKKLYGENNLIYSTDSSKTYACSKDVNNNQIMLSGEVDKLTQFIKLSENIESSTKTAIVRNTSTENYITYDGTCEITINKSSGELLVKNINTEEEHIHSFVSNPYSVDIRILPNDILLIVQQDNDIPTAIVYKIDLTTQSITSMTLDCNVSYSSSYKDLEFADVDAINKKLYFISNVQTASTSMKFKFGYINLTNMTAVLLVDKSVTFSSGYPHTQELSTIFTQNGNVVVYMGRYYNSKDYASMTIYSRENDSIVLNVSEKQVDTTGFNNLFKTYCNVVAYDDGTTLYWGSDRLNKSSLEYSFDGTDYTVPYFMDYSGKYAFSYFTGDSIIIFDLEKNTNLSIPFPNVSVAIVDDKYNHSAAGFNCAPIIKDDKLQVLFTGHYFISPIYNVEEASILDYEYMLVCSATSISAFYPQYSYSKINSGTISSEQYNTALNTAKQIEGSAE